MYWWRNTTLPTVSRFSDNSRIIPIPFDLSESMSFSVGLDISALDPSFREHAARGIGRYVAELKGYFDQVTPSKLEVRYFDYRSVRSATGVDALVNRLPFGRMTIRQQFLYPSQLKKLPFDLIHFPAHMDVPSWTPRRAVVTVLDLIPLVCRDLYLANRPSWRYHLARWLEIRAIKSASLLIAISECTKRDVHRLLGVPEERIVVTPLGVDPRFAVEPSPGALAEVRERLGLPDNRPLVLYVGGIDPRKNYQTLLRAFSLVRSEARDQGRVSPLLVLGGRIVQDREYPRLVALMKELELDADTRMLGYVADADLPNLYRLATVFLFPSLYEGFGLPPLEAMAAGLPVVSSGTSAMPEVLGDAARVVDPTDAVAMAKAVSEVLSHPELAAELRHRGQRRAALFSWSRTGELTLQAYEKARVLHAA